ncbi:MAG: hypothetical protein SGILL_009212, partial [Bacillariaceae sp.]
MVFSSGMHSLPQIGAVLIGNVITILLGTFFNNLSDKRQYPTAWFPSCDFLMGSTCVADEREKAVSTKKPPSSRKKQTVRGPTDIAKQSTDREPHAHHNNSPTTASKDLPKERNTGSELRKTEDRSSLLQVLSSFISGEASKAVSLQHQDSLNDDANNLDHRKDSDDDGTIDLALVLAQAKNPIFIVDHGNSVSNQSVFRISAASQHPDGSLRYNQYVMNDHSGSENSGTIDLSEVLAAAAGHSDQHGAASNQPPDNLGIIDGEQLSQTATDISMVEDVLDINSSNGS